MRDARQDDRGPWLPATLRRAELAAIFDTLLRASHGSGAAITVRGEPGSGVSSLLAAAASALPADVEVIRLSGLAAETTIDGGAVARLGGHLGLDADAVTLETLTAAAPGPTAVLIDDAQWLDAESRQLFDFWANRLAVGPVSLCFGLTEAVPGPVAFAGVDELVLAGLSEAEIAELVTVARGVRPAPQLVAVLAAATGGNLGALAAAALDLTAAELDGRRLAPNPPRLAGSRHDLATAAIADLSESAQRALGAVAAGADTAVLLQHVVGSADAVLDGISAAEEAGLLVLHEGRLSFTHPVVRSAAYYARPTGELRAVHGRLAAVAGAASYDVGRHLAAASIAADEGVAAHLEALGVAATAAGERRLAAVWFAESVRLTLDDDAAQRRRQQLDDADARIDVTDVDLPAPRTPLADHCVGTLDVQLLGGLRVCADGADVTPADGVPALALKAVALEGALHIEALAEVLWPGAPPGVGRNRLRNVLNRLRTTTGAVLVRDGASVRLAPGVRVDAHEFQDLADKAVVAAGAGDGAARTQLEAALARYGGELLPADRYADWTSAPRERLARRRLHLMDLLVDVTAPDDLDAALRTLQDAIALDPLDEARYVRGAELLERADQRAAALGLLRRARTELSACGLPLSRHAVELIRRLGPPAPGAHPVQRSTPVG